MAQVESKGIVITLSNDEAIALTVLLGNLSRNQMESLGKVTEAQSKIISDIYFELSSSVPSGSAN